MKNFSFLLTILFGLLCPSLSAQSTSTWTGATSTDWATAGNWSPAGVPTSGSTVIIPDVSNQPILDADYSIASMP